MLKCKDVRLPFFSILISVTIVYTILTWLVPLAIDDYWYINRWNASAESGDFNVLSYIKFVKNSRVIDNFRIGNMIAPLFLVFQPFKFLFPFFNGLMMSAILLLSYKLVCGFKGGYNCLYLSLIWAAIICLMPWRWLFVTDFSLNYIWCAAITLLFLYLILDVSSRSYSRSKYILLLILAFVAGGWHEGFAITSASALLIFIISRRGKVTPQFYGALIVYALAALFFIWSPGLIYRASTATGSLHFVDDPKIYLIGLLPFILIGGYAFFKKGRKVLRDAKSDPVLIIAAGIFISGYAFAVLTDGALRCYFWPILAIIIGVLRLLFKSRVCLQVSKRTLLLSFAIYVGCMLQSIAVLWFQHSLLSIDDRLKSKISKSEDGIVFDDFKRIDRIPWWCFDMPVYANWNLQWQYYVLANYFEKPFCAIVPSSLRTASISKAQPVNENKKFYRYGAHIISEYDLAMMDSVFAHVPNLVTVDVDLKDRKEKEVSAMLIPFITRPSLGTDSENCRPDTLLLFDFLPAIPSETVRDITNIKIKH